MTFLASLWGKAMMGAAVVLFIAAAFFCNRWMDAVGELQDERDATAKAEAEIVRTQAALVAAESRATARATQTATQRRDEEVIRNAPETYNCASSPAVRDSLRILRDRRASDTPADGDTAEPSDLRGVPANPG
jgi:hypothetical protein